MPSLDGASRLKRIERKIFGARDLGDPRRRRADISARRGWNAGDGTSAFRRREEREPVSSDRSFGAQLRAALGAALLLALCQIVVEIVIIAAWTRHFVLSPQVFFGAQVYDFCVKVFLQLPGATWWLRASLLDRFLPDGFLAKLALGGTLVVPNLVVGGLLGVLVGVANFLLRRPARLRSALWGLATIGFVVHVASWVLRVYIPKTWDMQVLVRQVGRVFIWEGTVVAMIALVAAVAVATLLTRLQPRLRWGTALAAATAMSLGLLVLPLMTPAALNPRLAGQNGPEELPAHAPVSNVILISIDSLRADRLGCYGNNHATSPTIDRVAREGVRFADAMSTSSWTLPAHMSLLTGRYVLSHGVIADTDRLPDGVPTLAETLHQAGVRTGGIASTPLLGQRFGFGRGFDYYDESIAASPTFDVVRDEPAPATTDLAMKWLRESRGARFFLFVHYWDVHYDYTPPPPYDSMFDPDYRGSITGVDFFGNKAVNRRMPKRDLEHLLALYDGEIRWVDDHIARLLSLVEELGIAERTAIIVTADHGDEFFEHGFKGHGRTLYREVVQVPLIIRVPGMREGEVVATPVSLADVAPTVLNLMGVRGPAGIDGHDLFPVLARSQPKDQPDVQAWLCSLARIGTARRSRHWGNCQAMEHSSVGTLIHRFQPLRLEFYAGSDFAQRQNLARSSKWPRYEQLALLRNRLNAHWSAYRGAGKQRTSEIDVTTRERLRALGYGD
jgi:arylsulfatase A-like enzyme